MSSGQKTRHGKEAEPVRAYYEIAARSFQQALAYRFQSWMMLISNLARLLLMLAIWHAVSGDDPAALGDLLAYTLAVQFLANLNFPEIIWTLPVKIQKGEVAVDLVKPFSQPLKVMAEQGGKNAFFLLRAVPVYVLVGLLLPLSLPAWPSFLLFLLSATLGHLIFLCLCVAMASVAFWVFEADGVFNLFFFFFSVLSGMVLPFWILPDWFVSLVGYLPFQAVYYLPGALFTGQITGAAVGLALGQQVFWLLVAGVLVHLSWAAATRKVVIQGG